MKVWSLLQIFDQPWYLCLEILWKRNLYWITQTNLDICASKFYDCYLGFEKMKKAANDSRKAIIKKIMWRHRKCDTIENVTPSKMWHHQKCHAIENVTPSKMWRHPKCDAIQNGKKCEKLRMIIPLILTLVFDCWLLSSRFVILQQVYFDGCTLTGVLWPEYFDRVYFDGVYFDHLLR